MAEPLARIRTLIEERNRLLAEARGILETAEKEKRALTDDEDRRFNTLHDEAAAKKREIDRMERQLEAERQALAPSGPQPGEDDPLEPSEPPERAAVVPEIRHRSTGELLPLYLRSVRADPRLADANYAAAFNHWLRAGNMQFLPPEQQRILYAVERRDLQTDNDTQAGFLVMPQQMVMELIADVDDQVHIRMKARKFPVTQAKKLGAPKRTARASTFVWASELGAPTPDTSLAFGMRVLEPHYLTGEIKVSNDLLRSAALPADQIVREELAYHASVVEEQAFLTGSGAQQPLGIFTASADGISTSRDISEGNLPTQITFDGLISAKYALKGQYWARAEWLFHRDALKQIAKLKDGEGQYLWRQSVTMGEPDRILNSPVTMSEFAPNTFTSGLYVGIFGDFQHYWIADALDYDLRTLMELYARTNQVGFLVRLKTDGMPVLEEAFARVKLG